MTAPDMTHAEADLRAVLAELGELEYERQRKELADQFSVRATALDRIYREERKTTKKAVEHDIQIVNLDPWPDSIDDGEALFHELVAAIQRFIFISRPAAIAATLWLLHSHAHDATDVSPILLITAATKGCGKSTLLDVLERLVPRALLSANATPAVLYRTTAVRPTLLVDEADTFLSEDRGLIGFFNAGHRRGVPFMRCEGDDNRVVSFDSWTPKAMAQIGMPRAATIIDRSVVVKLQRKGAGEQVEKFRKGNPYPELRDLARQAARWGADELDTLRERRPTLPAWFDNRLADNWEPLIAIAEHLSPEIGDAARKAAESLAPADEGLEVLLLRDLQSEVFFRVKDEETGELEDEPQRDQVASKKMVEILIDLVDRPWATLNKGKSITPNWIARRLKPFGIESQQLRDAASSQFRGYRVEQFYDAWTRYAPRFPPEQASQPSQPSLHGDGRDTCDACDAPPEGNGSAGEEPHTDTSPVPEDHNPTLGDLY
jgi:putative DNA primase/helicase